MATIATVDFTNGVPDDVGPYRPAWEGPPRRQPGSIAPWVSFIKSGPGALVTGLALVLGPAFVSQLLGAPSAIRITFLWTGVLMYAVLWCIATFVVEREHSAAEREADKRYLDEARADFWRRFTRWVDTRPERLLLRSSYDPLRTVHALMRQSGGTIPLGVEPDTRMILSVAKNHSVGVFATPQGGKTTSIVEPAIIAAEGAVVATSTKNDTIWRTYLARIKKGRVWLMDPTNSVTNVPPGVRRVVFSPRSNCATWDGARKTARSIIDASPMGQTKEPYWNEKTYQYLAPLLFAAALHQDATMIDVRTWVNTQRFVEPLTILGMVAANRSHPMHVGAGIALELLQATSEIDERALSGITSSTGAALDAYNTEALVLAGKDNFDAEAFVRSADTLYIIGTADVQRLTATLNVNLIETIRNAARRLNEAQPFNDSDRPPVLFAMDEMTQIAPLKEMPRFLADAGGQGMQFLVVFQSLSFAKELWPQMSTSGLLEMFNVKVAFGGQSDSEVTAALSQLTGDHDREYVTYSHSTTTGESWSQSDSHSEPVGLFQGHNASNTTGSNAGGSRSTTSGTSRSTKKERRYSQADISTIPLGHALVLTRTSPYEGLNTDMENRSRQQDSGNLFQMVELLGTWHPAWGQFVTPRPAEEPTPWVKPDDLPVQVPFREEGIARIDQSRRPPPPRPGQPAAVEAAPPPTAVVPTPASTPQGDDPHAWRLLPGAELREARLRREREQREREQLQHAAQEPAPAPVPTPTDSDEHMRCPVCDDAGRPGGCPECDAAA